MAIRWDWKDKMGEVIYKNGTEADLYQGNAMAIAIVEFADDTYNLAWFSADEGTKGYDNCMKESGIKKLRLNTRYKSVPKIVSAFAKAKMEIEIELYIEEEPKQ